MKYILIYEDGDMAATNELSESETQSADDGVLDIIRVRDMTRYIGNDNWEKIPTV